MPLTCSSARFASSQAIGRRFRTCSLARLAVSYMRPESRRAR